MEIIKEMTINGLPADMWRSRDAEGRKVYAVTLRGADGTRMEPAEATLHTQQAAIEAIKLAVQDADLGRN